MLMTNIDGKLSGGLITETEAYAGISDKASHAYGGRRTARTEIMFKQGGLSYVYLCYGVHFLFNVVTGEKDKPHAVLIRGIFPTIGIDVILKRRKKSKQSRDISNGPGKLTQALGITLAQNNIDLTGKVIWIEETGLNIFESDIGISKRIGVEYAAEDADLPYRFLLNPNFLAKKNAPKIWSAM